MTLPNEFSQDRFYLFNSRFFSQHDMAFDVLTVHIYIDMLYTVDEYDYKNNNNSSQSFTVMYTSQ